MLPEIQASPITRDNLNEYLKDLAKEFRRLNGNKTTAEIILIGGAAVLANYGFREMTYDIDAIIVASSAMKDAIGRVRDKHGLPHDWLNTDFKRTASYSDKLFEVSRYYRTFSNIVTVRVINAEYLLAMKLMSGRQYKYDKSDVIGILWEHRKNGNPIEKKDIERAAKTLYGETAQIPESSRQLLDGVFLGGDYEALYKQIRANEKQAKQDLVDFERDYPNTLKDDIIDNVIEQARRKRDSGGASS
jgi:hypothetical protein